MSAKNPASIMPNRDMNKSQTVESKVVTPVAAQYAVTSKVAASTAKVSGGKCVKDAAMSPGAPSTIDAERTELLGSLTTQQQQRTSARVIKKLRLEPPVDRDKRGPKKEGVPDDIPECETPNKLEEKDIKEHKFPMVKQRMPKALWSTDEKNLFFEALNEYGKDFDAITAYICAKMKKKGMPDGNLKTKTQVSHFYYRTWHKLSKHVHFDENVKKVAQELYALINYGELRKKLVSINEKTCARLGEMVLCGSMMVRARGKNVRVRTPMCRALRRLNQITELSCGLRVCSRAVVVLRARDASAWARVQGAAHNPRAAVALPLRTRLAALLQALHHRWRGRSSYKPSRISDTIDNPMKCPEDMQKEAEDFELTTRQTCAEDKEDSREDLEDHLNLETDRIIIQEQKAPKKLALHLGPRPGADVHLPVVSPSEQLSSQKICFSSYLERMGKSKESGAKIRTPKRQRKDSTTDKDKDIDSKKFKMDDTDIKLVNIEETAIDGIELMASYKNNQEDEEKPSTEDEKEREIVEDDGDRDMPERDKDMSERDKDSFSEMEDDEKYNKSDTDNESDHGKDKGKQNTFKNLKVKFRIRPKKRGGSMYTLVMEKEAEEARVDETPRDELPRDELPRDEPPRDEPPRDEPPRDELPRDELPRDETPRDEPRPDIDVDMAIRQIRKGWSVQDAGELTVGDLYLMFGSRSKLEMDYWWAEPTSPLPQPQKSTPPVTDHRLQTDRRATDKTPDKVADKGADSSVEDERERARESDNDILSPKNTFSQDSNDGMSGDERKCEQLASPEHKSSSCSGTLKLVSKLINRPNAPPPPNGFALMSDRLKRLLALVGNPHVGPAAAAAGASAGAGASARSSCSCSCGHVCAQQRKPRQQPYTPQYSTQPSSRADDTSSVFRHPTPIAPRPDEMPKPEMSLDGIPRWRRGRPRLAERRVVVQRLLPLLPKLPPPSNLIPVKMVPNSPPAPPRILPKPPPTTTSDFSVYYMLSEYNGQYYFHDGDRRIPIAAPAGHNLHRALKEAELETEDTKDETISNGVKVEAAASSPLGAKSPASEQLGAERHRPPTASSINTDHSDIPTDFLPSESMSLSPSRLLRDAEGWLEGSVQDFSLSSFLGHLEGRQQPDLAVDSHLQSLMAESSVDYVAKFADLAAEVTDEVEPLPKDELT